MKFICLRYQDRNQRASLYLESLQYDEKLRARGHLLACESVQGLGASIDLSSFQGQIVVTEKRSEGQDRLDGLIFLEARDLNHAILLISNHPGMKAGWFKIYPTDESGGKP